MPKSSCKTKVKYGAKVKPVNLSKKFNWPQRVPQTEWWQELAKSIREYPSGKQTPWGIPFNMACENDPRVIMLSKESSDVKVSLNGTASYLCILHTWQQIPKTLRQEDPTEGLLVGEYVLTYQDGTCHTQPIRARFEVQMRESAGPAWLAMGFTMSQTIDPTGPTSEHIGWGRMQRGIPENKWCSGGDPLVYAMPNPHPKKKIRSLTLRGIQESPLLIAGLTLYQGTDHPLRHLPRRAYRVKTNGKITKVKKTSIDLGIVARTEQAAKPRGKKWVSQPGVREKAGAGEEILHLVGAPDATVSVELDQPGKKKHTFNLGQAFNEGVSQSGDTSLEILNQKRQWMQIRVIDGNTGKPTPVRIHFSGPRGEYIAPYGHHEQVNTNWFEDYGADLVWSGRNYAYVPGEFTSDMPVGDVYVEVCKGFEFAPMRKKITIRPGQKVLNLKINREFDLRSQGWVTADTHVHFLSPQTAWLEGQAEGVNVVNLLASQWGRLFTNVGDLTGRVGVVEDDTIVYVGTENRNHMLGHMSMLGTQGQSVFPMCCGGPVESWVGDPDFMMLTEWARENKRKGGVVIRPHFPFCGNTEDPVPIIKGVVDALEINSASMRTFPVQEWYRYLNCGYRVAVCGGTDKMNAGTALGWVRTYAKIDPRLPFTYDNWSSAVRAGRTFTTNGPLIDMTVDGKPIGDAIKMTNNGGTVEVEASTTSFHPLGSLEIVCNGRVIASAVSKGGQKKLHLRRKIRINHSGWLAARCYGHQRNMEAKDKGAHTSPVYITCGKTRAFDGPAAEHMLSLVEGGIEYLNTIATCFDEAARKRMVKEFKEVQQDLKIRLVVESNHTHHHGSGQYHTHGHGVKAGHNH